MRHLCMLFTILSLIAFSPLQAQQAKADGDDSEMLKGMMEGVESKGVTLRYRFPQGHLYRFANVFETKLNFMEMEILLKNTAHCKMEVLKKDEAKGVYELKGKLDRLIIDTEIPDMKKIHIDTDDAEFMKSQQALVFKGLIETSFFCSMDSKGKPANLDQAVEQMYKQIQERIPGKVGPGVKSEIQKIIENFFGVFPDFPKKESVKKSKYYWFAQKSYPLGNAGVLSSKNKYYYLGVASYKGTPCAKIAILGKSLSFQNNPAAMAQAMPMLKQFMGAGGKNDKKTPMEFKYKNGSLQGEAWISLATGETVYQKLSGKVEMSMNFLGQDMDSDMEFTLTYEKLE